MKPQAEIERVQDAMANNREAVDWMGDNFKAGLHVGKLTALGWVLDEMKGSDLAIVHDYESWMREARIQRGDDES